MAYGSEMLNAVNDIKTALGGTDDGGIEYGSELLNTVVDIKTIVENGGGGGGGGGLMVTVTWGESSATMDKTYAEISSVVLSGIFPVFTDEENGIYYLATMSDSGSAVYSIGIVDIIEHEMMIFSSSTEDGTLTYSWT